MPLANPSSAVGDGRKIVATAGTREQLAITPVRANSTCVTALETNTGKVVVGGATVVAAAGSRRGTPLAANESLTFNCDPTLIWLDVTVNGEGVSYSYEAR